MSEPSTSVRRERGLSLIELLVAVLLLTVGALGAVSLQRSSMVSNQASFSREVAVSLARQLIEATRNRPYASLSPTGGWSNPPNTLSPANPLDPRGETAAQGYTRQWQVAAGPQANTRTIRVRVSWTERARPSQVELATVRAWE